MRKIFKRMKKKECLLIAASVLLILGQIYFELTMPDYMKRLTTLIQSGNQDTPAILSAGALMLGCALAGMVLTVICGYLTALLSSGFTASLRQEIFEKTIRMDRDGMNRLSIPSLIVRTTNDVTQIQMLLSMGLMIIVRAPIMAIWAVLKIINKSWELSLVTAIFVAIILALMSVILVVVVPRFKLVQKLQDQISLVTRENLTGISVVRAFNAENYQKQKFEIPNDKLMRTQLFNQRAFAALMPALALTMNGLSLAIYGVGAVLIERFAVTDTAARIAFFSDMVVFTTYAAYVISALMMIVMIFMLIPAAQVSAERINEVLDSLDTIRQGSKSDTPEQGTLSFRDVSFRYPDGGQDVLRHISFDVKKGQTTAIIGTTGCGKSTLINLAARLYDPTEGNILLDGTDIRELDFSALYNRIGLIPQKPVLFSGTLRENIAFGDHSDSLTDADIQKALELSLAAEFTDKLEGGLSAQIEQGGKNLSGGQKQRLSIARTLARKPEIIIFDDSFSALDYRTDALLRKGLTEKLRGTTLLIVAQRISTIRHADQIIVLEDGEIAGIGRHEELLKTCSVYHDIAASQLSEEELNIREVNA